MEKDLFIDSNIKANSNKVIYSGEKNVFSGYLFECSPFVYLDNEVWKFLKDDFKDIVFSYPFLPKDIESHCGTNSGIALEYVLVPIIGFGYLSLYKKDAKNYNAKFQLDKKTKTIKIIACKTIKPQEEIIINTLNYVK